MEQKLSTVFREASATELGVAPLHQKQAAEINRVCGVLVRQPWSGDTSSVRHAIQTCCQ